MVGYHRNNGYRHIEIEIIHKYKYLFHFYVGDTIYETKETDDADRYINHLSKEYEFVF